MGIIEKAKDFLFPDKRKNVLLHLDEEKIRENEIIKAQQKKIASYEAYFGKLQAKERESQHEEEQEQINQKLIEEANEQAKDIKAKNFGKVASLGKFYYRAITGKNCPTERLYDSLSFWGKNIDLVDKNDEVKFGKWGDFVLLEGGKLALVDSDTKVVSNGQMLHQVIYKPDGFENQITRGMIKIPCDKDMNWTPDLDYMQISEPLGIEGKFDEGTGQIVWGKVKKSEVKKIVARLMSENQELMQDLEFQESVNLNLKKEFEDLTRKYNLMENKAYSSESSLSQVMKVHSDMEARWGEMQNRLTNATELNLMWQKVIDKKDQIIDSVLTKLEEASNTTYQRVKQEIMSDLQAYKGILPEQNTELIKPEVEQPPVQPNQPIKS